MFYSELGERRSGGGGGRPAICVALCIKGFAWVFCFCFCMFVCLFVFHVGVSYSVNIHEIFLIFFGCARCSD